MAETVPGLIQKSADITVVLEPHEELRLIECEAIIRKDLQRFLEVGRALSEIKDCRLYRRTHKSFEKYCKDVWDLGKTRVYQKINGYRAVTLLKEKTSTMVDVARKTDLNNLTDKYGTSYAERMEQASSKCTLCGYMKAMNHKNTGVRIPGQHGKCTNPEGLCEDYKEAERKGALGAMDDAFSEQHRPTLPINERQARPLTDLKNPDDQVKAWGIVLEWLNDGKKLTASLIKKAVKEVRGEVFNNNINNATKQVKATSLVTDQFKKQFDVLAHIINDERNNKWRAMSPAEVIKHLDNLIDVIKMDSKR
jgi:hypothetical protein